MGRMRMEKMGKRALYAWILAGMLLVCASCGQRWEEMPGGQEEHAGEQAEQIDEEREEGGNRPSQSGEKETPLLLKVATTKIPESTGYQGLEMLKDKIERESGGTIEVQLYPSEQLGDQMTILEGIRMGTVEMAFLPVETVGGLFPEIFGLVSQLRTEEEAIQICQKEEFQKLWEDLRQSVHIRCMGFSVEGVRNIWVKERIEDTGDFEGLRLWTSPVSLHMAMFQSLGASTNSMPLAQAYDGFQAGLLDGAELDAESILRYNLYEKCKYCLETRHAVSVDTFFMSEEVFQEMTGEQKEVVQRAAEEVSIWLQERYERDRDVVYQTLEEKGVTFYRPGDALRQELEEGLEKIMWENLQEED